MIWFGWRRWQGERIGDRRIVYRATAGFEKRDKSVVESELVGTGECG